MKILSKMDLSGPISAMVILSLVFPISVFSQVSKPKKPYKLTQSDNLDNTSYAEEIHKVIKSLPKNATLGQFFERLDEGIDHKGKEQLLKSFRGARNWRDSRLPDFEISANSVTVLFKQGKKTQKVTLTYEFRKDIFVSINGHPIYVTEVDNPKLLMSRTDEVLKKILGHDKSKKHSSFLLNLLLPKAHAGFGLSIGVGFIGQIFSMIMMYKMMKTFTKAFTNRPAPHHHHHYYPPPPQQPYYPPYNPYNQVPANPYYGAPFGGTR